VGLLLGLFWLGGLGGLVREGEGLVGLFLAVGAFGLVVLFYLGLGCGGTDVY
jgi:hypothetical protein